MKLKRLLSATLICAMLISSVMLVTPAADAAGNLPFSDVKEGKWYTEAVKYVYNEGIMEGAGDGKFNLTGNLTRAMLVKMLGSLDGAEKIETDIFPDVKKNSWYSGYVGWAYEAGIVKGLPDGSFGGNNNITRQEMAVMISRYIGYKGINMPRQSTAPVQFADADKVGKWAASDVEALRRAGITNGNTAEEFMPKANITRAEAAQILKNLADAETIAWQGYIPSPASDGYAVYGASYLYYNGTAVSGGLGTELDETGTYQILSAFPDELTAKRHSTPANSTGICTSVFEDLDLDATPVVKICYSYDGYTAPAALTGRYVVNPCRNDWSMTYFNAYIDAEFTYVPGADDDGYKTATYDLTSLLSANSHVNDSVDISHILVDPVEEGYDGDGKFNIRYIAFFKDQASADAFTSASQADYLKNYFCYASVEMNDLTGETKEYYDELLTERINEILNSESAVTPEMIESNGGKCYYISSINGDDSNDGLTPKTPYRTTEPLYYYRGEGNHFQFTYLKQGDAVFFERGSVFYPETYHDFSISNLGTVEGVTYSAYGEGEKPLFTCSADFTEHDNVGVWLETEWDNIWRLEEIDYDRPDWSEEDVGNIIFDGGKAFGVRVFQEDIEAPFGADKKTYYYGLISPDGKESYYTGGTSCESVGTALKHNYEFFFDHVTDELYLYWDKGNPADSFEDIEVSRNGTAVWIANDTTIDNLAFMYSSNYGGRLSNKNIVVQNCEIGYIGGSYSSVASGLELYGTADNIKYLNNYIHDVQDGSLSIQDGTDDTSAEITVSKDVEIAGNVVASSGNAIELWIKPGWYDDNGVPIHSSDNYSIHDNIWAYIGGYSFACLQPASEKVMIESLCLDYEMYNSSYVNNIMMYPGGVPEYRGELGIKTFHTDTNSAGYLLDKNVYIVDPTYVDYVTARRDNLNDGSQHSFAGSNLAGYGVGVDIPIEYRYLAYMSNLGIGNSDKYYIYDSGTTEALENDTWPFFLTGYWVEQGGFKK